MNDELCPICLESLKEKDTYKIQCKHVFHTDCIMKWFRLSNASCPCCLDNPNNNQKRYNPIFYGTWNIQFIEKRCNSIKKLNKKNPENDSMNKKFIKLDKYESELNQLKKDQKDFINDEIVKEYKKKGQEIRKKVIRKDQQIKKLKVDIVTKFPIVRVPYC
tara:strand:+ start:308 stop:790 length:483 start_codon:yes stop_codon:yes gene_type:complete